MNQARNRNALRRHGQTRRWARLEHLEARHMLAGDLPTSEFAAIRLEATDLSGVPITQIETGQSFLVKVYFQDRRGQPGVDVSSIPGAYADPVGFFAAFISVTYDKDGFDYDPTYDITPGSEVEPVDSNFYAETEIDGYIGRLGLHDVVSGFQQPHEVELLSFRMIAEQPGVYSVAEGFQPHFHFHVPKKDDNPNIPEGEREIIYIDGVPKLVRLTGAAYDVAIDDNDEYIALSGFNGEILTEDGQVFFQGVDLEVLPASTPNAEFDIRFVKNPTMPTGGEVNNLPNNLTYIDEWETFYVEVYATVPTGSTQTGLTSATVQLSFTPGDFEFVEAIGNTTGDPAIRYSVAYTDDQSDTGSVTVSFTTLDENLGDNGRHALVGRILVRSLMEVDNDTSGGYIYSVPSTEITLAEANATLIDRSTDIHSVVEGTTPGGVSFDVWPVMYDADEDRRVGLSDFAGFVSAFGQPADTPHTRKFDFDKNGVVGLSDFNLFVQNFGQTGNSREDRIYSNHFPAAYQPAALMGSMIFEGEPVEETAPALIYPSGPPQPLADTNSNDQFPFASAPDPISTPPSTANTATGQGSDDDHQRDEAPTDTLVSAWPDQSDLLWQTASSSGDAFVSEEPPGEFSEYADEVLALWDHEEAL